MQTITSLHITQFISLYITVKTEEMLEVVQVCTGACCSEDLNKPYHPSTSFNRSRKQQGKQMRCFMFQVFNVNCNAQMIAPVFIFLLLLQWLSIFPYH